MYSRTLRIAPGSRPPRTRATDADGRVPSPMPPTARGAENATLGNLRSGGGGDVGCAMFIRSEIVEDTILILSRSKQDATRSVAPMLAKMVGRRRVSRINAC